jgi:hypothetical protein
VLDAAVGVDGADLAVPADHLRHGALLDPRVHHLEDALPIIEADRLNKI